MLLTCDNALCYGASNTDGFLFVFREATIAYKAEALELQKQLRHLQSQFDILTGQASALIQGRRARVAATSTVNGHLTTIDDSLSGRNLQVWNSKQSLITLIATIFKTCYVQV